MIILSTALMKLISHIQNEIEKLKQQEIPSDHKDVVLVQENDVFSRVNLLLLLHYLGNELSILLHRNAQQHNNYISIFSMIKKGKEN